MEFEKNWFFQFCGWLISLNIKIFTHSKVEGSFIGYIYCIWKLKIYLLNIYTAFEICVIKNWMNN